MKKIFFIFLMLSSFSLQAELKLYYQTTGTIDVSVDAIGSNKNNNNKVFLDKPTKGFVRKIFILATSNKKRVIKNGDVLIDDIPISWDKSIFNDIPTSDKFFNNVIADVTNIFKDKVNNYIINNESPRYSFSVKELGTSTIDGVTVVVVYNNSSINKPRSFSMFFGDQSTGGDDFFVSFKEPLVEIPEILNFGLGVSYGFQGSNGTNMVNIIDINDDRLTSSAGGEDDGGISNGELITVGGTDDSISNPDPLAPSTGSDTDDELYDLKKFVKKGDKGFTIKSNNPSDDDNIFFAYLYSSIRTAALPPSDPPKEITVVKNGNINKDFPTIVLIHGLSETKETSTDLWTGFGKKQAGGIISNDTIGKKVNIIQYVWRDAFHVNNLPDDNEYTEARNVTYNAGVNLAKQLILLLGDNYNKKIHFIGHSLGTAVSTYAISALHDGNKNIKDIQFTALDRPDHVTKIVGITNKEEKGRGYHKDFFALNLPFNDAGLDLKLDNYYSDPSVLGSVGVGDIAVRTSSDHKIFNHLLNDSSDVNDEIGLDESDNDHSGVHQWYRWTMIPNGFNDEKYCSGSGFNQKFDKPFTMSETLNPCNRGWRWSINKSPSNFPTPNAPIISKVDFKSNALISDITDFGCNSSNSSSFVLTCKEQSSPFSIATITIPENTTHISFNYKFDKVGDGDYVSILIDGSEIWKLSGSSVIKEGVFYSTGFLPINIDSGNRNLTISLQGVNEKNAEFMIKDIVLHSIKNESITTGDMDKDKDGMLDEWEIKNGLNPNNYNDATLDLDLDNLDNLAEFINNTNPNNPDTDGDGFNDGDEVLAGTDPLDSTSKPVVPNVITAPIPTLSEWAMIYLSLLLGVIGFSYQKRRKG